MEDFKYLYLAHKGGQSGVKDLHVDWCGVDTALIFCGEVRSEHKSEIFNLPADLRPYPNLWSWGLGSDQKNENGREWEFPNAVVERENKSG